LDIQASPIPGRAASQAAAPEEESAAVYVEEAEWWNMPVTGDYVFPSYGWKVVAPEDIGTYVNSQTARKTIIQGRHLGHRPFYWAQEYPYRVSIDLGSLKNANRKAV